MSAFSDLGALVAAGGKALAVQSILGAIHRADAETAKDTSGTRSAPAPLKAPSADSFVPSHTDSSRNAERSPIYRGPRVVYKKVRELELVPVDARPCCVPSSPFQPPWKTLPWPGETNVRVKIKIVVRRIDVDRRGALLDCFV
jgi:hypothetical protein